MSSNIHIFTHSDLDGAGCLMAILWAFPDATITYTAVSSAHSFEEEFLKLNKKKPISQYDVVFVTDLSILEKDIHLIDRKNVIFIDHHKSSLQLKFSVAKTFISKFTSCTLLVYKLFKSKLDITNQQKHLLILIDDYDSYTFSFSKTRELNTLFWSHYQNNISLFLEDFNNGFVSFTPLQRQALLIYQNKLQSSIDTLTTYKATLTIQGAECKVVAAFADIAINDISDYIINKYVPDVAIVINLKTQRVSFRRNNKHIDVSILAKKLCDGGGHEAAAGGKLTEKFLEFTRMFEPT